MSTVRWTEIWVDATNGVFYLLLVQGLADGSIRVTDPQKGHELVTTFAAYDDATVWLNEDEYELVEGRRTEIDEAAPYVPASLPASSAR